MRFDDYDSGTCSVARTLEVLGDRWSLLVLRDVFNGVHRFADIQRHLGIARDLLTRRLATLVDEGVLERVAYREPGARQRFEYRMTQAGRDLRPVLLALITWGDRYRGDSSGPPAIVTHAGCGAAVRLRAECDAGHRLDTSSDVDVAPGPGARRSA